MRYDTYTKRNSGTDRYLSKLQMDIVYLFLR